MTAAEVTAIETAARKKGATPNSIMADLEKGREKKGLPPLSESAVRRVLRGEAYQRAMLERRGRPRKATKRVIKAFEKSRAKVSKKRKGKRVTYKMIMTDAGIKGKVSVRRLQPVLKEIRQNGGVAIPAGGWGDRAEKGSGPGLTERRGRGRESFI